MPPVFAELALQVSYALRQAGFHVISDAAIERASGLHVGEAPEGVLIRWLVSDGFTALAFDQPGASSVGMRVVVQAAVSGLLVQMGHTVMEASDGEGLLVLANVAQPDRPAS
ncbi:hypothetical protein ABZ845_04270 [Streptomyces sp. NPDC047022]|uniref:hypothetical protein n=1 Tax=Streptomyces sp. NPDC047022 TaxID=3155737 RepID=UPI0033DAC898